MKKFIVLSALVAIAGVTVGLINRSGSDTQVVAAADVTTTTTAPPTSSTTAAPQAAKVGAKTTATTVRRATTPTTTGAVATTSTSRPVTTTTVVAPTTTTTVATVTPTCTVTAANPSVHKGDSQTISIASNMPSTKTRLTIQYPKFDTGKPNPRLDYTLTTDAAGNLEKTFSVGDTSTVPVSVSVQIYDAAGHLVSGCQTTFEST